MFIQERKKEKEKNKDNSTHINSNSITYIIRRTSITLITFSNYLALDIKPYLPNLKYKC